MSKKQAIVAIGIVVALLPFLGFPRVGESVFQVLAGLSIIGLSVWSTLDKKLAIKARAQMRARKIPLEVAVSSPEGSEEMPKVPPVTEHYGKRVTDFYPKTGQHGRRASDLKAPLVEEE